ncbi:sarcosine oxidase subunit alpha family protein [Antarcticimicrobium luteum]|uniref:Sarcosine oxidase subunit alpha family protein n=1 Tax=Antarcticimicrobium luteum TaxID=2547397 RepID=A0A4R5VGD8_9RHOB|nr:sarcosine oxidase subunit alpha family protein [Antarcticimicrobium luteum]TDK51594.1 sarcosine oxidase subunit alpha family protein [Antarcticimicrobium luteum]
MRVAGKGLLDRSRSVPFRFDGVRYAGLEGDTLASALLANGVKLVGRSFKYHRPRGILTAGSEEPNALVTIGRGGRRAPNTRATVQEIYEGLEARSQNAWPSLKYDLLGLNDLAAPFLGAGFYYKTFMWPKAFWEKLYEPAIRRAAGLGALSGVPDADRYERAYAFCDLLVIGAGPAGLMAALVAGRAGADVILADEEARMGGRLLAETHTIEGRPGHEWAAEVLDELAAMENVRLMARTTVAGAYDQGTFAALERVGHHRARAEGLPLECFWRIVAKRSVLAAGALERPVAFPDNDRPGIMTAGAVRAYLNRWGVSPGRAVSVFANNDDAHRTARDLVRAGVDVVAVIDSREDAPGSDLFEVHRGAQVVGSVGRLALEAITLRSPAGEARVDTDCLAMSGGWNPSVHLSCHMNARPVWRDDIAAFVPTPGAVPGMIAAGACNGTFATLACLREGAGAARGALEALGMTAPKVDLPAAEEEACRIAPLWAVAGKGRAWLDFQNDVTVKDVKQAAAENYRSVEHMKRYTTQGMATDQGKSSNVSALAVLADATGRAIPETGTTTFRPPYSPIAIAALGAGGQGKGFAPERFTTSHRASVERGAPMIEAGLWYRPGYFPAPGEKTWRQSCDREVSMVREAVGVCDVSTLGKIDIQGPDAGEFLDFVYSNTFSTLKVGRVRYGLMLREDGTVMDDGTTARLGDTHYLMTTTTAAAGEVMRHLDFVSQGLRPELDVRFTSVTEQWAQFAVAGPKSRDLLNGLLDDPLADGDWPFMACGPVKVLGAEGRLFRISFSGEHAYELAVPARFGDSLFRALVARAEGVGGGAYGMEALNVLRIEKGLITHAEIHGRVTAFDAGMGRMVSAKKDCIGKTLSQRPGLLDPERERLVGLKPVGAVKLITAGGHLFEKDAAPVRENDQGYVTSAAYSPTLGHMVALGFLRRGPERRGEVVKMVDHLRGVETLCEVVDPVFFDPKGGRVRG